MSVYSEKQFSPIGLYSFTDQNGALKAKIISGGYDKTISGKIISWNSQGESIGETGYRLKAGELTTEVDIVFPSSIRNQISYMSLSDRNSAGSVSLLDARSLRYQVGILTGETSDISQPLLSHKYYLERALGPYVNLVQSSQSGLSQSLNSVLASEPTAIILADIGKLISNDHKKVHKWVKDGGVLIRFSGQNVQNHHDDLLPVQLRHGRREFGGALSWSTPQKLANFERSSPFYGLEASQEISIHKQVLADPKSLSIGGEVWSRLQDGTPLVTAKKLGDGWVVLFHITANSDWSNLPLSGLFVEMLIRLVNLPNVGKDGFANFYYTAHKSRVAHQKNDKGTELFASEVLNGFGELVSADQSLEPVEFHPGKKLVASSKIMPGYYGGGSANIAVNVFDAKLRLQKNSYLSEKNIMSGFKIDDHISLKAILLCCAMALLLLDTVVRIFTGSNSFAKRSAISALVLLSACVFLISSSVQATAKDKTELTPSQLDFALKATLNTHLGYVITGDKEVDRISKFGLSGLSKVIAARTAIEPAEPIAIDILKDEIAFFPILYWPVVNDVKSLPDKVLSKIDTYLKRGGMILFDTKDAQYSSRNSINNSRSSINPLRRIIGKLNIPRLVPVYDGHVVSKSFYLLKKFPGRWDGGALWVQVNRDRNSDGVSSIVITSNDFAGAWALDENNRPMLPVVPGGEFQREMAFRVGVNIVMYALTGNYKADQVHVPALLERLGQ